MMTINSISMQRTVALTMAATLGLSGCATDLGQRTNRAMDETPQSKLVDGLKGDDLKGTSQSLKERGEYLKSLSVIRAARSPWIGGALVPTTKEDSLPALFNEKYAFDFGEGMVPIGVMSSRLTKMTGVPVRIRNDVFVQPVGGGASTFNPQPDVSRSVGMPMPGGVQPMPLPSRPGSGLSGVPSSAVSATETVSVNAVSMKWNGKLRDFLDHLTNALNLTWEYRDGAIVIMRLVTQTHSISVLPGAQKYTTTVGSSSSGTSQSGSQSGSMRATSEFSESGSVDAFMAIVESIRTMTSSVQGNAVVVNAQTGSVVVTSSKEVQAQIRDYLSQENARLRQMVNVTLDIYTIKKSDSDEQSINWSIVYRALSGNIGASINSSAGIAAQGRGGVTITKLDGAYAGSNLVLNALRSTGNSVSHRPVSMTTLNGKLRSQAGTNTVAYVKETTPGLSSSSGAAGAPGLKTDTIVTGDMFSVLPVIQPDNSVIVKYSVSLSSLIGITNFTSGSGSSAQSVQIPTTDAISDSADLRIGAGESYLITGLSRLVASDDNSRLTEGAPIVLGGGNKKSVMREHFVVLVRATPI